MKSPIALIFLWLALLSVASAQNSPYTAAWQHTFATPHPCVVLIGAADSENVLWLFSEWFPRRLARIYSLGRIDPSGKLLNSHEMHFPGLPDLPDHSGSFSIAANGTRVGLLVTDVKLESGPSVSFEGAFFIRLDTSPAGAPEVVSGPGPQFLSLTAGPDGSFLAVGDQEPLTLVKIGLDGKPTWRRSFSARYVLPETAVASNGDIYVVAQDSVHHDLLLMRLDRNARLLRRVHLPAKQATVAASADGCVLMYSAGYNGPANHVFLGAYDQRLQPIWTKPTPFTGYGGRTYELIGVRGGYVAAGEADKMFSFQLVSFDRLGNTIGREQPFDTVEPPLLIPTQSGFYIVRRGSGFGREFKPLNFTVTKEVFKQ